MQNLIHDVIPVCQCKTLLSGLYDGDTQGFYCGACGRLVAKLDDITIERRLTDEWSLYERPRLVLNAVN